jgi:hypothetical protein
LKKISAILLVFIMMLCGSGFYVAWHLSLQSIRDSQRALISNTTFDSDKIVKFAFPKSDLKTNPDLTFKDDGENEFEYREQMYDVISKKNSGDTVYLTCISDKDEDHLNEMFIAQILETGNNTSGKQLPILKFRLDHFTSDVKTASALFRANEDLRILYKTCNINNLPSPFLSISSPPPKNFAG